MSDLYKNPTSVVVSDDKKTFLRQILAESFLAARAHDGREANENRLLDNLAEFEAYAKELAGKTGLVRDEVEQALSAQIRRTKKPVTVSDLLGIASNSFLKRLKTDKLNIAEVQTEFTFLPTEGRGGIIQGQGAGSPVEPPRFEPRTQQLIQLLNQSGIYTDDLLIYRGTTKTDMMRKQAYSLIQIPRLDREILINDQVGEASFIGEGLRGCLFWATYRKDQVRAIAGVNRVIHNLGWEARVLDFLLTGHKRSPKTQVSLQKPKAYPLTEDLLLMKAIEFARDNNYRLPTPEDGGDVKGLPGETWRKWGQSVRNKYRGLTRENMTLPRLFQLYGLRSGRSVNLEVIQQAIRNLESTGTHGLTIKEVTSITADLIINKALKHAQVNENLLPNEKTRGEITGMSGETWKGFDWVVRLKSRGFDLENVEGLSWLFRLYGLKIGWSENPERIALGIKNLKETGHHGLEICVEPDLTEDLVLNKALEYAKEHNWKLPNGKTVESVPGMPGQKWNAWHQNIRLCGRGFTRENMKGLSHLFGLYGLVVGRSGNVEAIQRAYENLQTTGHHGLVCVETVALDETSPALPSKPKGRVMKTGGGGDQPIVQ